MILLNTSIASESLIPWLLLFHGEPLRMEGREENMDSCGGRREVSELGRGSDEMR
jgi:hypothetical protein